MMETGIEERGVGFRMPAFVYTVPLLAWALLIAVIVACIFAMSDALGQMWRWWFDRPEYSHGSMMPLIAAFLIWQRRDELMQVKFTGAWSGLVVALVGLSMYFLGELATVYTLTQYGFIVILFGLVLALVGYEAFKLLVVPLLILLFMLPLPNFIYNNLSAELQLISSQLGVALIRLFDISVFLQGNVIDLGIYQLEVAEACNGLRYLFPLMAFAFVVAYFFKGALWKRLLIFFAAIPLTILMNGLRVGLIGVMVDRWGIQMAEGFVHDFQGWIMFMISALILVGFMFLLGKIGNEKLPSRELFGVSLPEPLGKDVERRSTSTPASFVVTGALVIVLVLSFALTIPNRDEAIPERNDFAMLDLSVDGWSGRRSQLDRVYVDALKVDDYFMGDFVHADEPAPVNFYVAWYDSQRAGQSAHSPRSCIPGGGWEISSIDEHVLDGLKVGDNPLRVNRVVVELGNDRMLVYYWFQQRGRVITNEYLAKWYLFWDSLTRNRTDGALVRFVAPMPSDSSEEEADEALRSFAASMLPELEEFVPN